MSDPGEPERRDLVVAACTVITVWMVAALSFLATAPS